MLLVATSAVHAQSYGLDVQPEANSAVGAEPSKTVTLRFKVTNRNADAQFEARVVAPANWRVVGRETPFALAEGQTTTRTVKVEIPADARAGDYSVAYAVNDTARPTMRNEARAPVRLAAAPDTNSARPGAAARAETLLLDVSVNGQPLAGIIRAERLADGRLALPAQAWAEARLLPAGDQVLLSDGTKGYALEAVPGADYKLDRSRLALAITVPAAAFDATQLALDSGRGALPSTTPPGIYLNYDLAATRGQGTATSYGAIVEGVAFTRWGALVASGVFRQDYGPLSSVRLDTFWRTDLPWRMESLVIGDTIGSAGYWSRPVRFGGVRYARDFTLAPGYITYPMPSIGGSAALPSTVDVLINNQRINQSEVQPGPFELTNVPIVTGAGNMQVVVRDMLGRETVINQSYYVAPQLLAKGLSDFSYEAGAFRFNYGTQSNDYGSKFGAGTFRLGLTDTVTGEVRGEVQRDRTAAGAAVAVVVGELGVVALGGGYAVSDGQSGGHYIAGAQRSTPKGGASVAWEHFDRGYIQFGSTGDAIRPKDQVVAGGGIAAGHGVNLGLNYTRRTAYNSDTFSLGGANIGVALPWNAYVSLYVNKQFDGDKGWSGGLTLIVPIDDRRIFAASSARDFNGNWVDTAQATQSVPAGPGWGWRVAASDSESQRFQAGAVLNTNYNQLTAEANAGKDTNAVRLGANGSLGWMQGTAFASRRIDQGSFAIVQVGDIEGVAVSLSNQIVATTGSDGRALITGLLPYQLNQLTVNPDQLPFGVEINGVGESVIPYARSGAFINFPVKRSRDVLVALQQPGGAVVPAGARVTVSPNGQTFVVARRGEVYLVDVQQDNQIEVRWKDGGCTLPLPLGPMPVAADVQRVGPLICGSPP
ncbi:MAG: fimbria/pilus outer membrane usher protein [Casimicrobiaceae bacterium]